jgi:hypothetical protein
MIRKLFTYVTNISPNMEIHFLLTGFFTLTVGWQLSWYQNSHQDLILTLQEVLDLLVSAQGVLTGSFEPPSPDSAELDKSWRMRKWHLRTCWFIITHRGVKLTIEVASGLTNGRMAPPFSSCLPFSWLLPCLLFEAVELCSWRVSMLPEKFLCPPDSIVCCLNCCSSFLNPLASSFMAP